MKYFYYFMYLPMMFLNAMEKKENLNMRPCDGLNWKRRTIQGVVASIFGFFSGLALLLPGKLGPVHIFLWVLIFLVSALIILLEESDIRRQTYITNKFLKEREDLHRPTSYESSYA